MTQNPETSQRRPGRPATGQTPVVTFRPPTPLREALDAEVELAGRSRSDVLIEAVHDWIAKRRRERGAATDE